MDDAFQVQIYITAGQSFYLPLPPGQTYDFIVAWGDGSPTQRVTAYNVNNSHTYADNGWYTISMWGTCTAWAFIWQPPLYFYGDAQWVRKILNFVDMGFTTFNFYGATNLTEIATNMNRLKHVTDGDFMFHASKLASIPAHSFDGMTNLARLEFAFQDNITITTLPADIFLYNNMTTLRGCFYRCTGLQTVPANLFRSCTYANNFDNCFDTCNALQQNKNIFYADGEQSTRFTGVVTVSFQYCFHRTSFTGSQGTAPDLWNCTYNAYTPIRCWNGAGNSLTSLTNYADIPAAWKV